MNFYQNFYKSKTFFLFLYFVCRIPLSTINVYGENDRKIKLSSIDQQEAAYSLWIATPLHDTLHKINATKDSILFVVECQKKDDKNAKYSFKVDKLHDAYEQQFDNQFIEWSSWSTLHEKKYALSPGNYVVYVKIQSDSIPEQLVGRFPINIASNVPFSATSHWWWVLLLLVVIFVIVTGFTYYRRKKQSPLPPPPILSINAPSQYEKGSFIEAMGERKKNVELEKSYFQKLDMVTVLFADIEGFSDITDSMDIEMLLDELNHFFFHFDVIVDRYHIEKIKTMGDAYMCAGGLLQKDHTNPVEVVLVAVEVQNHLNRLRKQNPNVWSVRVGIHTGQVMAGMLGHKKMSYDIWGTTVNKAARLESSCKAGEINISETTYKLVKQFFDCEYQGKLSNKTNDVSYYVKGLKAEFIDESVKDQLAPNRHFFTQMQLLRLLDIEEYVKDIFNAGTSNLPFHNIKHIRDVYEQVELLGHSENISEEDLLLVKTAALFHDVGYATTYKDAPVESEKITREALPLFQYDPTQIDTICRLVKASHYESTPNDALEQILHDANLMYYGRVDFISCMMNLFYEQQEHQINHSQDEWLQAQISRLSHHRFYTQAAEKFITVSTNDQIAQTEELLNHQTGKNGHARS